MRKQKIVSLKVQKIRAVARELREDRGRSAGQAMKVARRYVRRFPQAEVV